jgi:putative selenium metabolism protein SsnA
MRATLLIGGTIVSLDPVRVASADLVIHDDTIGDMDTKIPTTSTVDCTGCVIMSGFVLAHTHLYSALAPGMPAPKNAPTTFREILERIWWRLDEALDEEAIEISAEIGAAAAVRAGVTTIVDHHESPRFIDGSLDVLAKGIDEIGIRSVLTYGATDRHGEDDARKGLLESERFFKKTKDDPRVRGMIGLHAPFTCTDRTLEACADIVKRNDAWTHLHAAEWPDDQRAAKVRWKVPLFVHLDRLGLLGRKTLAAHAVDLSDEEAMLIQARGAFVAHQARSNMNNGVGYASKLSAIDRVAIGTDGIDQDVLEELRAAFFRRREMTGPSAWPSAAAWLARGQQLASEVFGQRIGAIEKGAPADLVVLSYDPPTPLDPHALDAHLLFGLSSVHVRDVFVAGRAVMRNRKLVGIDEKRLASRAREIAPKLWQRMRTA